MEEQQRDNAQGTAAGATTGTQPTAGDPAAPDLTSVRAELHDRLEHWTPPAGADATEVAQLKTDLGQLIDNYQPVPGQSLDTAVAGLQTQFQDTVHDFTQDQKIDALVEEQQRDNAAGDGGGRRHCDSPGRTDRRPALVRR